jgi:hypothetical protein
MIGDELVERTTGYILLVCKHEQQAVLHLAVRQDAVELLARLVNPVAVVAVDDKDETLRARVVVPPERANLVLPSDVLRRAQIDRSASRGMTPHNRQYSAARAGPTQTLNFVFLYVTVSTLKPTVGMVVTDWLSLSL